MTEPKSHWSPEEKIAVTEAYRKSVTAEDFKRMVREAVPTAPPRTFKAYLSFFVKTLDKSERKSPMYRTLLSAHYAEEEARKGITPATETAPLFEKSAANPIPDYLNEVSSEPIPPSQPAKPAPAPNFVKPAAKPDPNARVPRHIPTPPASKTLFTSQEAATALGVQLSVVKHAMSNNHLPHRQFKREGDSVEGPFITRPVFDVLHSALSEGHSFEHACILAMEKFPAPTPIVPAEKLYAPVEQQLDDPNPDAKEAFTVEEAATVLGLSSADTVLTAIHRDGFPAVKMDGKWCLTRADLKRVLALRDSYFSVEEAFKRAGSLPVGEPIPTLNDTSWTDHLAPLTPEEKREADALADVVDRDPVYLPPPPSEIYVPETGDERVWTLEAIRDGVFTVEQARDILGLKDAARTNWALGLLSAGKVTLDQAAKLLR